MNQTDGALQQYSCGSQQTSRCGEVGSEIWLTNTKIVFEPKFQIPHFSHHFLPVLTIGVMVITSPISFDLDNIALMVTPTVIRPALVRCASARWRQIIQHRPSFNSPAG